MTLIMQFMMHKNFAILLRFLAFLGLLIALCWGFVEPVSAALLARLIALVAALR